MNETYKGIDPFQGSPFKEIERILEKIYAKP